MLCRASPSANFAVSATLAAIGLAGCASLPDARVQYYLPAAHVTLTATQAVTCDASGSTVYVVNSALPNVAYAADAKRLETFRLADLDSPLADANLKFDLTDDGRLKGVNATTTGQAEAIVKSAMTLATTLGAVALVDGGPCSGPLAAGKAISLSYLAEVNPKGLPTQNAPQELKPAPGTEPIFEATKRVLGPKLPGLTWWADPPVPTPHVVACDTAPCPDWPRGPALTLSETQSIKFHVLADGNEFWKGVVLMPTAATYTIPVPKSAAFGATTFVLTLSDPGVITSINYAKTTGLGGGLNAVNAIVGAGASSASTQAADLKAQADVIAQSQRLARCQANPATCQ